MVAGFVSLDGRQFTTAIPAMTRIEPATKLKSSGSSRNQTPKATPKIGLKNVIALKRTKSQLELAKFYSAASAFLTLSKSESFSLVCAEALACGSPVVGFDIGGISETVKFGFGTLKKYGDYDGIAEEINIISKRNANAKVISETYSDLYSKKTMYKNYFKLFSDNIISS